MGTNYHGTQEEISALDAFVKLVRAADSVSQRVEADLARLKLSASQFGVLEALCHCGPLYQKDLAKKILKSGGNITMVVDNLEKRGLVERVRDENDRRHYSVGLTKAGMKAIKSSFPGHVARIVREMSVLTKEEQEKLGLLCRKVGLQTGPKTAEKGTERGTR